MHLMLCLQPHTPTISTGPCLPTVAGPYAAWMPRKSLHGRTCGVSCDGGRTRTLQPTCKARRSTPDPSPARRPKRCTLRFWAKIASCRCSPLTIAGPRAAWIPLKGPQERIQGVTSDGRQARALQPGRRSSDRRVALCRRSARADGQGRPHPGAAIARHCLFGATPGGTA
jgi:hypothetical protein